MSDMINITMINGSADPVGHSTASKTVGELRSEFEFGNNIVVSVNGTKAADSRNLIEGALVSAVATDKTGG